jgi:hypothetical protein
VKKILGLLLLCSSFANASEVTEGTARTLDTWGGQMKGVVLYGDAAQSIFDFVKKLPYARAVAREGIEVVKAKNIKCSFNQKRLEPYECVFSIGKDGVSYPDA